MNRIDIDFDDTSSLYPIYIYPIFTMIKEFFKPVTDKEKYLAEQSRLFDFNEKKKVEDRIQKEGVQISQNIVDLTNSSDDEDEASQNLADIIENVLDHSIANDIIASVEISNVQTANATKRSYVEKPDNWIEIIEYKLYYDSSRAAIKKFKLLQINNDETYWFNAFYRWKKEYKLLNHPLLSDNTIPSHRKGNPPPYGWEIENILVQLKSRTHCYC